MALPPLLTPDQVQRLLAENATPTPADLLQILRHLMAGQADLEGRVRQVRSAVGRIGR